MFTTGRLEHIYIRSYITRTCKCCKLSFGCFIELEIIIIGFTKKGPNDNLLIALGLLFIYSLVAKNDGLIDYRIYISSCF